MSVILTLGVSLAGMCQGREEEEPYLTEGRRTCSLPTHLSHTCNYFPTAYTVSPSFLSTPSRDFSGGRSQQHPSALRASSSPRPAEDPGLLHLQRAAQSHAPVTPTLPLARGEHPGSVPLGGTFTFPIPNNRQRKGSQHRCLILPIQKIPLHPSHHTSQSSPLAIPQGKSKCTVPREKPLFNPKAWNLFHYFKM